MIAPSQKSRGQIGSIKTSTANAIVQLSSQAIALSRARRDDEADEREAERNRIARAAGAIADAENTLRAGRSLLGNIQRLNEITAGAQTAAKRIRQVGQVLKPVNDLVDLLTRLARLVP